MSWRAALIGGLVAVLGLGAWLWTPDKPRSELQARYLASTADLVQVGEWRLHVRDSGPRDAPVVLMLHGFGASLHTWDAWAQGLSATRRVIRFDLPGNGLSEPDPAGNYTDARSLQLVLALMDQLGVARQRGGPFDRRAHGLDAGRPPPRARRTAGAGGARRLCQPGF